MVRLGRGGIVSMWKDAKIVLLKRAENVHADLI